MQSKCTLSLNIIPTTLRLASDIASPSLQPASVQLPKKTALLAKFLLDLLHFVGLFLGFQKTGKPSRYYLLRRIARRTAKPKAGRLRSGASCLLTWQAEYPFYYRFAPGATLIPFFRQKPLMLTISSTVFPSKSAGPAS